MKLVLRFYEVLLSVYIFNEKRGYSYLQDLLIAFESKYPEEEKIIQAVKKHIVDERAHYMLFREYFIARGIQPFSLNSWYGYCDQMVALIFGSTIDQLDPKLVVNNEKYFFKLCRLIMITEMRGMKQVKLILKNPLIRLEPDLVKIFKIVQKDEPSHCYPYQAWLKKHNQQEPSWREIFADWLVHNSLLLFKLPFLFLNPFLSRYNPEEIKIFN